MQRVSQASWLHGNVCQGLYGDSWYFGKYKITSKGPNKVHKFCPCRLLDAVRPPHMLMNTLISKSSWIMKEDLPDIAAQYWAGWVILLCCKISSLCILNCYFGVIASLNFSVTRRGFSCRTHLAVSFLAHVRINDQVNKSLSCKVKLTGNAALLQQNTVDRQQHSAVVSLLISARTSKEHYFKKRNNHRRSPIAVYKKKLK